MDAKVIQLYEQQIGAALQQKRSQLLVLQSYASSVSDVSSVVAELPKKLTHPVLVPFGKHAFFPGELRHTNELTLALGSKYYIECTAHHAAQLLGRRQQAVDRQVQQAQVEVRDLEARLELSGAELGRHEPGVERLMEIRESVEESDALLASARTATSSSAATEPNKGSTKLDDVAFEQVFARLEELELQEAAHEAGDAVRHDKDHGMGSRMHHHMAGTAITSSTPADELLSEGMFTPVSLTEPSSSEPSSTAQQQQQLAGTVAGTRPATKPQQSLSSGTLKKGFLVSSHGPKSPAAQTKPAMQPKKPMQTPHDAPPAVHAGTPMQPADSQTLASVGMPHLPKTPATRSPAATADEDARAAARREAFTGDIIEREAGVAEHVESLAAPKPVQAPLHLQPLQAAVAVAEEAAQAGIAGTEPGAKRVSKFKQQMRART